MKELPNGDITLDDAEIEQALIIGRLLKGGFHCAATQALTETRRRNIPEHVFQQAVATEGLMIAAYMHGGTPESFVDMAHCAIEGVRSTDQQEGKDDGHRD